MKAAGTDTLIIIYVPDLLDHVKRNKFACQFTIILFFSAETTEQMEVDHFLDSEQKYWVGIPIFRYLNAL